MHWPTYQAANVIQSSGIIAYPTETVWGLGCDPFDGAALNRLMQVKLRDSKKGVILLAGNIKQLDFLLHDLPADQYQTLLDTWPDAVTFLVPHKNRVHPLVHGQFSTVAVRVSPHPRVQALCEYLQGPLVSTSANFAGRPTARSAVQARKLLAQHLDFILAGPVGLLPGPSRIVDLASGRVIRG